MASLLRKSDLTPTSSEASLRLVGPEPDGLSVVIWCPTGRDSALIAEALLAVGVPGLICRTSDDLWRYLQDEVGCLLLAQEALTPPVTGRLRDYLAAQPRWSDLPLIVLAHKGDEVRSRVRLLEVIPTATVLERPLHRELLTRAIQVALRTRFRQYELRDHLREREALLGELEKANAAKDEFLGLVSHELRTPASMIRGGAILLQRKDDLLSTEDKSALLSDMGEAAERLSAIIENLLLLARVDSTDLQEPLHVQRVLQKAAETFHKDRERRVVLQIAEGIPPAICNEQLFLHVIDNLLSNADKYSPWGSPVDVSAEMFGDQVEICVKDRGPGVKPDEMDTIFQRFYRSAATSHTAAGLGLGLTVCRRLIESQGGTIWAEAREGGGLEIHVRLPLAADSD